MNEEFGYLWKQMAIEVVTSASRRLSIQEFDRFAKLSLQLPGAGYIDRLRVLDQLIGEKVVGIDDRHLVLGSIANVGWIYSGLKKGDGLIWKIANLVDAQEQEIYKFNLDLLKEIGDIGELEVIRELRMSLSLAESRRIRHVSQSNDSLGFDIVSPSLKRPDKLMLVEVKTTTRPGREFTFFISRNEYRVANNNENWVLVGVQILDNEPKVVGYLNLSDIGVMFPENLDHRVQWSTCVVKLPFEAFTFGLP